MCWGVLLVLAGPIFVQACLHFCADCTHDSLCLSMMCLAGAFGRSKEGRTRRRSVCIGMYHQHADKGCLSVLVLVACCTYRTLCRTRPWHASYG